MPDNTSHLSKVYKSLSIDSVDFIVVGMSTAEHNYDIKVLEDSLKMTGFDCGSDGRNIYYDYMAVRNAAEKCNKLKLVVVDIQRSTLKDECKDRINIVYPFFWSNSVVRDVVKDLGGKKMDLIMLSSLYQMNSGMQNVWRLFHPLDFKEYHGYIPYPYSGKSIEIENSTVLTEELKVDKKVEDYLGRIVNVCKSKNVEVVLVTSPFLIKDEETSFWISKFAQSHKLSYLDFSSCNQIVSNSKLFKDKTHLNEQGAKLFSQMVAEQINNIFERK